MHKAIKRFGMEGQVSDDSDFARLRAQFEMLVVHQMRGVGYVPVLDLGPYWATQLNAEGHYDFKLSVYGVKVGSKRAWEIEGISMGREVPRTPPTKSKPSSQPSE